ncbi:hemerythrin domain-containing protein [Microbulbifer yueqingensis]|uniref:Hemerythrin-like domain-containing protein n=1 Tax=Microbulbifer yueqingensis TaxID=658219 RepID=A0A1G8XZA8_9GAMM|nr:hemerythrin domain-containing protein [Microbulbifer yueqingensis]SDJ95837.1 Hemerythrin-like domain-containing protein [Microbulbifer yueqingensis]
MDSIYVQLCRDHSNIRQMLDAFEQLLAEMAREERDPSTLDLILEALDYIAIYPEKWHHPVEEMVFDLLLAKGNQGIEPELIARARAEHRRLGQETRRMKELFYAVANDCAVERDYLRGAAKEYLVAQRAHIMLEEHCIFPLMERYLGDVDWELVRDRLSECEDAVFGPAMRGQYEAVRKYVSNLPAAAPA